MSCSSSLEDVMTGPIVDPLCPTRVRPIKNRGTRRPRQQINTTLFKVQRRTEREKVRVSFFQQSKPQEVDLPDEPIIFSHTELMMAAAALNDSNHVAYIRQESTESGWDNPFRPGGDLSREADEIVELIKGGKPITPTSGGPPSPTLLDHTDSTYGNNTAHEPITESPKKSTALNSLSATPKSANGNVKSDKATSPGAVDVQRGTLVLAGDASQVEHVVIKKKPKCECCVIQ
ncbi:hypothetical protein FQR65_LT07931 [Abscondita terminalis]|nr:hypothetical protein FQR65_LT07931 [Abscondita terminalis]